MSRPRSGEFDASVQSRNRVYGRRQSYAYAATLLLGALILFAPQLLGGVYAWSLLITAPISLVCLALLLWSTWREDEVRAAPVALLSVVGVTLWSGLQLLPLPPAVGQFLAPDLFEQVGRARELIGEDHSAWIPLSIDPGETRAQLVQMLAIASVFICAWILSARGERKRVIQMVVASSALMALVAMAHHALGSSAVFGLYDPVYAEPRLLAPILNENNLAGFLCLGLPPALALGWSERDSLTLRYLYLGGSALIFIALLFTLSRGGIATGLVAVAATLGFLLRSGRGSRSPSMPLILLGGLIGSLLIVGIYVVSGPLFDEFDGGSWAKLERIGASLSHALDAPLFGYGRGAFAATFAGHAGGVLRPEYAENFIAQWVSDWGFPVALGFIACLGWAFARAVRVSRTRSRMGALFGVAAIALHGLTDFGLEVSGIAIAASALTAAGLAPRASSVPSEDSSVAPFFRIRPLGVLVLGLGAFSLLALGGTLDADSRYGAQDRFQTSFAEGVTISDQDMKRMIRLHPLEPVFPLIAGAQANREQDPSALRWLGHAMHLAPQWAGPHLQASVFLTRRGNLSQALLELRQAGSRDPRATRSALCEFLTRWPYAAYAQRAAPERGPARETILAHAAGCLSGVPLEADRVDRLLIESSPTLADPRIRTALRAVQRGEANEALAILTPVLDPPVDFPVGLAHARALLSAARPDDAMTALGELLPSTRDERQRLSRWRAQAATELGDADEMRSAIDALRAEARGQPGPIEESWVLRAGLEEALGNRARAFSCWEAAYRLREEVSILTRAARLAERLGESARAQRYWSALCESEGPRSDPCAQATRIGQNREPSDAP